MAHSIKTKIAVLLCVCFIVALLVYSWLPLR
jgi:hypothetical protein